MKKYKLMYSENNMNYNGNNIVEIGKVVDIETSEDAFYVYYNKHLYQTDGYHMCPNVYVVEGKEKLFVEVDDLYRDCLYEKPNIFLTMMLHEYGHYINGDLSRDTTNKVIQEERIQCILEGKLVEMERKADEFAISHVGKNEFMKAMDYLIKKRKQRGDAAMFVSIKEFELRKKAASKLKL